MRSLPAQVLSDGTTQTPAVGVLQQTGTSSNDTATAAAGNMMYWSATVLVTCENMKFLQLVYLKPHFIPSTRYSWPRQAATKFATL
jgi:hypothetical protein